MAAIQDKRSLLYHSFEEALLKLKANKDSHAFQQAIKKIAGEDFNNFGSFQCWALIPSAEYKIETAAMGDLQATVKALSTELADKVGDIQKQDKIVKDLQTSQVLQGSVNNNNLKTII